MADGKNREKKRKKLVESIKKSLEYRIGDSNLRNNFFSTSFSFIVWVER